MPSSKTFVPYAISEDLELQVSRFRDTRSGAEAEIARDALGEGTFQQSYDLTATDWIAYTVELSASLPPETLEEILTPGERPKDAADLIVPIRCSASKLRRATRLTPTETGRWEGSFTLRRGDVADIVTLVPELVRTRTVDPHPGRACERGMIIAEGTNIRLRVDTGSNPLKGGLNVQWEDFRGSQSQWRDTHDRDIYHLDFRGSQPTLWLNARYAELEAVLHEPSPRGATATLKSTALAMIQQGVSTQLFYAALASVGRDEETNAPFVPAGWRDHVIGELLPHLYPDKTPTERLDALVSESRSDATAPDLASRLGSAVQTRYSLDKAIQAAIRAGRDE